MSLLRERRANRLAPRLEIDGGEETGLNVRVGREHRAHVGLFGRLVDDQRAERRLALGVK